MKYENTNDLIHASSPYLLQHAHNPVKWVEWSNAAFEKAKQEDKLVLISIGYSACHWCHVMAHESFEDHEVAAVMNKYFVCIKVDREERPDVDQIYMTAVQLMTQQGGWPLNCVTLPDARPVFGGTYFPKQSWIDVLNQLAELYKKDRKRVEEYAEKVTEGIARTELVQPVPIKSAYDSGVLIDMVQKWKQSFDFEEGGENRAPKFPLPNNYQFLLQFGVQYEDVTVLNHVHRSLRKMALGGLYDQLGGGFARYSVDHIWKVPHFEKMLYDNAQMLTTYAAAFQQNQNPLYKRTIEQTIDWLCREMQGPDHGFYSALDADSEGEEGKFYTWSEPELKEVLGDDYTWFSKYYNVNKLGYWENGNYILYRTTTLEEWCEENKLEVNDFEKKLESAHTRLNQRRNERIRPGLDDKEVTSWNAMLIKGFVASGLALQDKEYLDKATQTAEWLLEYQYQKETHQLYRIRKDGKSTIFGFLEDYAHTIDALIALFEAKLEVRWIKIAQDLLEFTLEHFNDTESGMFYFTDKDTELLVRKMEINDNVIPASNSVMANNLLRIGKILQHEKYIQLANQMLSNTYDSMVTYGSGYSNWGLLALHFTKPSYEVVISGEDAKEARYQLGKEYLPQAVFTGSNQADSSFLKDRSFTAKSTFYVCQDYLCNAPTQDVEEAIGQMR